MNDPNLRQALLATGGGSVGTEVTMLNALVTAEHRRARRLLYWTVGVWAVWLLMLMIGLGVPIVQRLTAPPSQSTGAPTVTPIPLSPQPEATSPPQLSPVPGARPAAPGAFGAVMAALLLGGFVGLPVVGVVLLIAMLVSRRAATLTQISASLATIDAQLKQLVVAQQGPSGAQRA